MRYRNWAVLVAVITGSHVHAQEIAPEARTYLEAAIQVMQDNFLHKEKIDWAQLRRDVLGRARDAQTPAETYRAIRFALGQLGDRHSYLSLTPELAEKERSLLEERGVQRAAATAAQSPREPPSPFMNRRDPDGAIVEGGTRPIGRIVVPQFTGSDGNAFATKLQGLVADVEARKPCAWIVDLRGNTGGNMWPMLAGIGPVLGEGEPGGFLNYEGKRLRWFYENGRSGLREADRDYYAKSDMKPVVLAGSSPVAVLIDGGTASSGEAIAVAFRGRPDTRFFGQPTMGVSNSTFPFKLADGAQLYLVVAVDLDRNGTEYNSGVMPDDAVQNGVKDPVQAAATNWLSSQNACSAQ